MLFRSVLYANISTGNYNENTSRVYTDLSLFTADKNITKETDNLFSFLESNYKMSHYKNSLVAPMQMRRKFVKLIETETANAKAGKPAFINLKLNNLADREMVQRLREAAMSGVKINMLVRSTCTLLPEDDELKNNITIRSIVDRYLEHSRIMIFHNNGKIGRAHV